MWDILYKKHITKVNPPRVICFANWKSSGKFYLVSWILVRRLFPAVNKCNAQRILSQVKFCRDMFDLYGQGHTESMAVESSQHSGGGGHLALLDQYIETCKILRSLNAVMRKAFAAFASVIRTQTMRLQGLQYTFCPKRWRIYIYLYSLCTHNPCKPTVAGFVFKTWAKLYEMRTTKMRINSECG